MNHPTLDEFTKMALANMTLYPLEIGMQIQ